MNGQIIRSQKDPWDWGANVVIQCAECGAKTKAYASAADLAYYGRSEALSEAVVARTQCSGCGRPPELIRIPTQNATG